MLHLEPAAVRVDLLAPATPVHWRTCSPGCGPAASGRSARTVCWRPDRRHAEEGRWIFTMMRDATIVRAAHLMDS
jgi:hypothetical protein